MTLARETTLELTARPALTLSRLGLLLAVGASLSGCGLLGGSRLYHGPDSVIATDDDTGTDDGGLVDGEAAIAYDPDGCQVWIIDDGLEGYSSPRFDPKTGLPVCDDKYPPGTVIGDYQSSSSPIADRVPR
jgi:hypothetical protein